MMTMIVTTEHIKAVGYEKAYDNAMSLRKSASMADARIQVKLNEGDTLTDCPVSRIWIQIADYVTAGDVVLKSRNGDGTCP